MKRYNLVLMSNCFLWFLLFLWFLWFGRFLLSRLWGDTFLSRLWLRPGLKLGHCAGGVFEHTGGGPRGMPVNEIQILSFRTLKNSVCKKDRSASES